jgi:hypothetical protein
MQPPCTRSKENWPPDYVAVYAWRQQQVLHLRAHPELIAGAKEYYRTRPAEFINHWCDTYDPRAAGSDVPTRVPFILFPRQDDLVEFLYACLRGEASGLIEKCRDMGATWDCCGFSVWLWLFWEGAAVGWGSRKEELVDKLGDPKSIFDKIRTLVFNLPDFFLPKGFNPRIHSGFMKLINPENGATITGEAGDNIGRGGRTLCTFKDESAHYEHPEAIEAALSENTRVQIDLSSVNGVGNVFHRRRENGVEWVRGAPVVKDRANVFVMDWRDHPTKTKEWYDTRKSKFESEGLGHIFAQEVDRNYAAAVAGIIIKSDWVKAAIDAHITLGIPETGAWGAALDVADDVEGGGNDRNALIKRRGIVLKAADEWGEMDTGKTARRAASFCDGHGQIAVQYDCIGVGAGVKAEVNRLIEDKLMPPYIRFIPWNAAASPQHPKLRVIKQEDDSEDKDSPTNEDFYANLKAQGWWELRFRFYRTYQAVMAGARYDPRRNRVIGPRINFDPNDLISIDGTIPVIRQIEKELSQPTAGQSTKMKLLVNKAPDGTRSPNLGDAIMMAYFPIDIAIPDWLKPKGPPPVVSIYGR